MGSPVIYGPSQVSRSLQKSINYDDKVTKRHDSFAAANNQAAAASITGLDISGFRGGAIELTIDIQATADLFAKYKLEVIQKNGAYQMSQEVLGDETNIVLSITAAGLIQYTSGNEAGFVSSTMAFSASLIKE